MRLNVHWIATVILLVVTGLMGQASAAEQKSTRRESERRQETTNRTQESAQPNRRNETGRAEKEAHGNKVDAREATLYEKYDKDGRFQKHGITKHENPNKRYTAKQIGGGSVVRTDRGPRTEMIKKERALVEKSPGPENREPWAGSKSESKDRNATSHSQKG